MTPQEKKTEQWEKEFDKEFTFLGTWGEKRFTVFRISNYSRNDPIIQDDQVIADLKGFITELLAQAKQEGREEAAKLIKEIILDGCEHAQRQKTEVLALLTPKEEK